MRVKRIGIAAGLVVLLLAATVAAADYKTWIPLLPEQLGGLPRLDQPEGLNVGSGGQAWSTLTQEYARDDSDRSFSLVLVSGAAAPEAQAFEAMSQVPMETSDQVVKLVPVGEYRALLQLDKDSLSGSLIISVGPHSLVVLQGEPVAAEDELLQVAREVPLKKIAAALK